MFVAFLGMFHNTRFGLSPQTKCFHEAYLIHSFIFDGCVNQPSNQRSPALQRFSTVMCCDIYPTESHVYFSVFSFFE